MRLAIAMTDNDNTHDCEHDTTVTVDIYHYHEEVQKEVLCEDCDHHLLQTFTKDDVEVLDPTPE